MVVVVVCVCVCVCKWESLERDHDFKDQHVVAFNAVNVGISIAARPCPFSVSSRAVSHARFPFVALCLQLGNNLFYLLCSFRRGGDGTEVDSVPKAWGGAKF